MTPPAPGARRHPQPHAAAHVAQLCALGQRVREVAEQSGMTAPQLALKFVSIAPRSHVRSWGMKTVQQVEENLN